MKNLLFLIVLNSFLQAQDYIPFIQNGNVWKYSLTDNPMCFQDENDRIDVVYDYSLGNEVIINDEVFKELYVQYHFKSLSDFIERKNCDDEYDLSIHLGHLDINNYNTRHLIGYVKEDIQNKKITINSINNSGTRIYDYINNNRTLLAINEVTKYNIHTKEYEYDYLAYSPNKYYLYEGIGDGYDFFRSTFDHIDPPFSGLYAFSSDNGTTFYTSNNQLLGSKDIYVNSNYSIVNNPSKDLIQLNTIEGINSIKVVNILGQIIFEQMKDFEKINIENLPSGIYYLVIEDNISISKLKLIKK